MKQAFDFGGVGFGMLAANAFTADVTIQFVQIHRHGESPLARHLAIAFDLLVQARGRIHATNITRLLQRGKIIQPGIDAKRLGVRWQSENGDTAFERRMGFRFSKRVGRAKAAWRYASRRSPKWRCNLAQFILDGLATPTRHAEIR
jgi:hypothetical protein